MNIQNEFGKLTDESSKLTDEELSTASKEAVRVLNVLTWELRRRKLVSSVKVETDHVLGYPDREHVTISIFKEI